jgi:hypothetical protein
LSPDSRKYSSEVRVCSWVLKIEIASHGSNPATSSFAARFRSSHSAAGAKSSTTRKPSRA